MSTHITFHLINREVLMTTYDIMENHLDLILLFVLIVGLLELKKEN